jgi:hypothetical protein
MMKSSSQLTRMIMLDWLKQQRSMIMLLSFIAVPVALFTLNPIVSSESETVVFIRSQQIPDKYQAYNLIGFIKLANGRTAPVSIPTGQVPPAPGSSIRVMHSQHLLLGDSFQWIQ